MTSRSPGDEKISHSFNEAFKNESSENLIAGIENYLILDEVFISSNREKETLKDIPHGVSIIRKEEIEKTNSIGLHEILKSVPGMTIQNRFGTDDSNISIRGSGVRQTFGIRGVVILVDGIPMTEPDGQTRIDLIDMDAIERVEVVRGPASNIYGGNSTGGVINLITKRGVPGSGFNSEERALVGSYGYAKGYGSVYGNKGDLNYFMGTSYSRKDGYRNHSEFNSQKFNGNLEWKLDDKSLFRIMASAGTVDLFSPGSITQNQMNQDPRQADSDSIDRDTKRFDDRFRLGTLYKNQFTEYLEGTATGYMDWRRLDHVPFPRRFFELERFGTGGGTSALSIPDPWPGLKIN